MPSFIWIGSGIIAALCFLGSMNLSIYALWKLHCDSGYAVPRVYRNARVHDVLTQAEYWQFRWLGHVEVASQLIPGRRYVIPADNDMIIVIEQATIVEYLCLQIAESLPDVDVLIAIRLYLLVDEREALACAQHFAPWPINNRRRRKRLV